MGNLSTEGRNPEIDNATLVKKSSEKTVTPIKAIRAYCLDCSCDSANEVRLCPITGCPLYPFRKGHNPNIKPREYTEEERVRMREHGRAIRAKQLGKDQ